MARLLGIWVVQAIQYDTHLRLFQLTTKEGGDTITLEVEKPPLFGTIIALAFTGDHYL
jgi:hypothetical protein